MNDANDREILVGENKFYLGKNNIIYVTLKEDINNEAVLKMRGAFFKFLFFTNEKCDILAINKKGGKPPFKVTRIFKDMAESENFGKVAIINSASDTKPLTSFILPLSSNRNLDFFNSREDALFWLNE